MPNLPAILNHEEVRATILAELWFKEKKVDSSDWYEYIMFDNSRDKYKPVTGLLVTCLCTTDLSQEDQFFLPTHSGCQESQGNLVLKIH